MGRLPQLPGPILDWQPRKRLLKSLSEQILLDLFAMAFSQRERTCVQVLVGQGNESCRLLNLAKHRQMI